MSLLWPELLLGMCLGTAFLFMAPLWEAPDEPYHFVNIAYITRFGPYAMTHGPSALPQNLMGEFSQPPLYYLIAATVGRFLGGMDGVEFAAMEDADCWDEAWRFHNFGDRLFPFGMRALSLVFLLLCAVLLGRACRLAHPEDTDLPGTAVAMLWAVPQVLFIGTSISNDSLAIAAGALIFMLWIGQWRSSSPWRLLVLGIAALCAAAVKFSLIPLGVAGIVLAAATGRTTPSKRVVHVLIYVAPWVLMLGMATVAAPDALSAVRHVLGVRLGVRAVTLRPMLVLPLVWESYWGRFGWMNVIVHEGARVAFWSLSVALGLGLLATVRRDRDIRPGMMIAVLIAAALAAALIVDLTHSGQGQGRHLFPSVAAMSFLGALGLRGYLPARGARVGAWLLSICGAAYVLALVLPRAYGAEPSDLILGEACCQGTHVTPSLDAGRRERQVFVSPHPGLCRVGLVPGTHGLPIRGQIRLSLADRHRGTLVAERVLSGREIRDGRYLFLEFAPIRYSRGREYVITVETVGTLRGEVRLFYSPVDRCPGTARVTGEGDLRFVSHHMPGYGKTKGSALE